MERRLTMATALTTSSSASSPLSLDALGTPAPVVQEPKRRRTSACDDLAKLYFTGEVRQQLVDGIGAAVDAVLDAMTRDEPATARWKLRMRKDNIEYLEDRETARRGELRFCCVSFAEAQAADVVQLFVLEEADTLLQRCQVVDDSVTNAKVLSVLDSPSDLHPHRSVYVRYTSYQTPSVMRSRRDMLVVVATDVVYFSDGSTIGYCVWDSLNLTELTAFDVPPGFVRTRMTRSGFFVHNSGERNTRAKVAYVVGIHPEGFAPRLGLRFVMPRFGAVLHRVCSHVRGYRLDPRTFVLKSRWPDKRTARLCKCCSSPFSEASGVDLGVSLFGSSRLGASRLGETRLGPSRLGGSGKADKRCNCHACGEVVCNSCVEMEEVDVSGVRRMRIPVCATCRNTGSKKSATHGDDARGRLEASRRVQTPQAAHRGAGRALHAAELA